MHKKLAYECGSIVIFIPNLSFDTLFLLFLAIGFFTSAQIIGYPLVAENSLRVVTTMSVSVVNISVQGGDAIFQPFFGYLLDKHMMTRLHTISTQLTASDFGWAVWPFPIGFVIDCYFARVFAAGNAVSAADVLKTCHITALRNDKNVPLPAIPLELVL